MSRQGYSWLHVSNTNHAVKHKNNRLETVNWSSSLYLLYDCKDWHSKRPQNM